MTLDKTSIREPLTFNPIYKETIWGGRVLETMLGKVLPPGKTIGESWEISGCGKDQSIVSAGSLKGTPLSTILSQFGRDLLGPTVTNTGDFPLLYKLIDAHDKLSVQVHPSDSDAHANNWGPFGKTECWYIVHAAPGAKLVVGFKKGVTRDEVASAVKNTTLTDLLEFHPITAGEMIFIPAGTVHAICSDTVIYEVQQTSDVTFRLYDWGRLDSSGKSRTLHVEDSLKVLSMQWNETYKIPPVVIETASGYTRSARIACRYFAMDEYDFARAGEVTLPPGASFKGIMVLDGSVAIGGAGKTVLSKGESALLPAAMKEPGLFGDKGAKVLVSWVPDLQKEIIDPLKKRGIPAEAIRALGGNPGMNDLAGLLL